jgi:NADPH-dependent curcumin reductase CurA
MRITLAARPVGFPKVSDFELGYAQRPTPKARQVLVRLIYLSLDPWLRSSMGGQESPHLPPIQLGELLPAHAVGHVVKSEDPDFREGDVVEGLLGWQEYAVVAGAELRKLDPNLAPISTALGVLGMPGLTAYFGLLDVGDLQPGETVLISGAAGGVGMLAGQIAKIRNCRVVGAATTEARTSWLCDELGFDAAFTTNNGGVLRDKLEASCPDGVDVYFDNVGGEVTDEAMCLLNEKARIVVCGQDSQDNLEKPEPGPRWLHRLIAKQARIQGFVVSSYSRLFSEGRAQLARWLHEGRLKNHEEVAQGLATAPQAFIGMLQGKNLGKQLVQVGERYRSPSL